MESQRKAMDFFIAFALPILLLHFLPQIVNAMKPDANKPHAFHGHDQVASSSGAARKRLHIAHVGGLNMEIQPKNVGGLEKVVEMLIIEQIKAGHKVTLFCTDNSGKFEELAEKEGFENKYGISKKQFKENFNLIGSGRDGFHYHTRNYIEYIQKINGNKKDLKYIKEFQQKIIQHISESEKDEDKKFDIIHYHSMDHFEFNGAIFDKFNHMTLTTLHLSLEGKHIVEMLSKYPQAKLVPISNNQRSHLMVRGYKPVWLPTVYNGYPVNLHPFVKTRDPKHPSWLMNGYPYPTNPKGLKSIDGEEYLAYLGSFSFDDGVQNAIKIALKALVELRIAANIPKEGKDGYEYFKKEILPLLKEDKYNLIKFVGQVNDVQKREFLGNALALLSPIEWQEPFGLVMIEAISMGTPVIGPAKTGPVSEIVIEKMSGRTFHVGTKVVKEKLIAIYTDDTFEEAAKLVHQIHTLKREKVRQIFMENFSDKVMADGYQEIYDTLIANKPAAEPSASDSRPESLQGNRPESLRFEDYLLSAEKHHRRMAESSSSEFEDYLLSAEKLHRRTADSSSSEFEDYLLSPEKHHRRMAESSASGNRPESLHVDRPGSPTLSDYILAAEKHHRRHENADRYEEIYDTLIANKPTDESTAYGSYPNSSQESSPDSPRRNRPESSRSLKSRLASRRRKYQKEGGH